MTEVNPIPKPPPHKKKKRPGFTGPRSKYCQYCGRRGYTEAHHIISRGAGGADTEDNRIDLCKGPGSNNCHDKAQEYRPDYLPADLERAKAEAEKWDKITERLFGQ